jgi:hypothetical protein
MLSSELSDEEIALVRRHRDEMAKALAVQKFKSAAIATAKGFDEWSQTSGEGLSFSTFINSFGYQGGDGKQMYEAVSRIFAAALPPA